MPRLKFLLEGKKFVLHLINNLPSGRSFLGRGDLPCLLKLLALTFSHTHTQTRRKGVVRDNEIVLIPKNSLGKR